MFHEYTFAVFNLFFLSIDLLLLTFCGLIISLLIINPKNKPLLLGSSMILGPLAFLLVLSIGSYVFKGHIGIAILFWVFVLLATGTFALSKYVALKKLKNLEKTNKLTWILIFVYSSLIFLQTSKFSVGADADMYWGIATSFTEGNYPTVLPWQINFLTVYHQGTFMIEGALRALSYTHISTIHYFFTAYLLISIVLLLTGIALEYKNSFLSIIPSVFGLVMFGGPVLLVSGFNSFASSLGDLSQFPVYGFFKSSNGGGAVGIGEMIYSNFYTQGLAVFLLFTFLYVKNFKSNFKLRTFLILVCMSVLNISIDETFFFIEIALLSILFLVKNYQAKKLQILRRFLVSSIVFLFLFFIIQNPIRDSMLEPSLEESRFKLLFETKNSPLSKYTFQKDKNVLWNGVDTGTTASETLNTRINYASSRTFEIKNTIWKTVDFRLLFILILILSVYFKHKFSLALTISSGISYLAGLVLVNTFWPPNSLRLINQAHNIAWIALAFIVVQGLLNKKATHKFIIITIIALVLPQFLVSNSIFIQNSMKPSEAKNYTATKVDLLIEDIVYNLPTHSNIVFVGRYPSESPSTYYNLAALSRYGAYIPIAPQNVKILNTDYSMEWFDAVTYLSPYAFKSHNIKYAYIRNSALNRVSEKRKKILKDDKYFKEIKVWNDGTLYEVTPLYSSINTDEINLKYIVDYIGKSKRIYLDKFYLNEIRKIFLLKLGYTNNLFGPSHSHGGDFFMYIETTIPFNPVCKDNECSDQITKQIKNLDYALMDPDNDPNDTLDGAFEPIIATEQVVLWENTIK